MNVVDLLILAIVTITVISGMYRGFVSSLLSTADFFLSWAVAYIFYPGIASGILHNTSFMETLYYYTDAASKLGTGVARTPIAAVTRDMIDGAIRAISLPAPFDELLSSNILSNAFSGLETVGDYVNQTIVSVTVNVLCFLLVFAACYIVINLLINLFNYVFKFKELRHGDALAGGALGLVRGYFIVFLLFTLVPILLTALPIQAISDYINASMLGAYFMNSNFITFIIKAVM